jgi:hypothetical protein
MRSQQLDILQHEEGRCRSIPKLTPSDMASSHRANAEQCTGNAWHYLPLTAVQHKCSTHHLKDTLQHRTQTPASVAETVSRCVRALLTLLNVMCWQ